MCGGSDIEMLVSSGESNSRRIESKNRRGNREGHLVENRVNSGQIYFKDISISNVHVANE